MSKNKKIAFLYPRVAHYREDFFNFFNYKYDVDIYTYINEDENRKNQFNVSTLDKIELKSYLFLSKLRIFNFLPLLNPKYKVVILIAEMKVIPTWFILVLGKLLGRKIILWGHGISMHSYLEEKRKLKPIRVLYHKLAKHIWLYTEKEKEIWETYIDSENITFLNNTIDINKILNYKVIEKDLLKEKYKINSKIIFIFSARFSLYERRTDLLLEIIKNVNVDKYGFIIIGDGKLKPDFSPFPNVYEFGALYDEEIKNELFQLADLYLQPGWIGLSCNEALAYGKPVLTFKRSKEIKQCVEYAYLNKENSFIAEDMSQMLEFINNISTLEIKKYQISSRRYAEDNLRIEVMIDKADRSLINILEDSEE